MSDNESNQASNSNDNYQAMPDEEEERRQHLVVVIPDLAPPDQTIHITDPGYTPPPPDSRRLSVSDEAPHDDVPPDVSPPTPGPIQEPMLPGVPDPGDPHPPTADPIIRITDPWTPPADTRTDRPERPTGPMTPAGTTDEGFWVWLSNHGVRPGDPATKGRIPEFLANYRSLPAWDQEQYRAVGKNNPGGYQFDTTAWADAPDLPGQVPTGPPEGRLPPGGPPEDDPTAPMPEPDPNEPVPEPDPIMGEPEAASFRQRYGLSPDAGNYDWRGWRLGRRTWNPNTGRYD